jgi:hypothetical protein
MAQTASAPPAPLPPSEEQPPSSSEASEKPAKKAKTERAPRPPKSLTKTDGQSKTPGAKSDRQTRKKRGPARPHRRLDIEIINARITKLEKRRLRAKEQLEDATRHVEGYQAERDFREQEAAEQGSSE